MGTDERADASTSEGALQRHGDAGSDDAENTSGDANFPSNMRTRWRCVGLEHACASKTALVSHNEHSPCPAAHLRRVFARCIRNAPIGRFLQNVRHRVYLLKRNPYYIHKNDYTLAVYLFFKVFQSVPGSATRSMPSPISSFPHRKVWCPLGRGPAACSVVDIEGRHREWTVVIIYVL